LRNVTPAPPRQNHTTSPYASRAFVVRTLRVHGISPHVRDTRDEGDLPGRAHQFSAPTVFQAGARFIDEEIDG
jgi:hypothetical protein